LNDIAPRWKQALENLCAYWLFRLECQNCSSQGDKTFKAMPN